MKNSQRGFIVPLVLVIIVVLVVGGVYLYSTRSSGSIAPISDSTVATTSEQTFPAAALSRNTPSDQTYTNVAIGENATFTQSVCGPENYSVKNGIEYWGANPIDLVDIPTFKVLPRFPDDGGFDLCLSEDSTHVFSANRMVAMRPSHITYLPLNGTKNCKYYRVVGGVGVFEGVYLLAGSDPLSFIDMTPADGEKQGMCYGKDSRQVYSAYSVNGFGPIVGADPKTFVVLNANYTKDASNVGYRANAMVNADPSTFTVLGELWAKDKNSAYHRDTVIYGADPETFMALDDDHAKDANHVYDPFGKIFDQVDAKTARGIGDGKWLIDSMHVYTSNGQILDQADPKTFSDLGSGYGKDTTHIFYGDTGTFGSGKGSIIPDADRASFAVIDNNYGKDSAHIYSFGKILVGADVNTFTRVGKGPYFKDKSHVWYEGDGPGIVEIPGADAATFVLTDASTYGSAKDAFHTYGFSAKGFFYSK